MSDLPQARKSTIPRRIAILAVLALGVPAVSGSQARDPMPVQAAGSKACADCHQQEAELFVRSVHARLASRELQGLPAGCEACHGPGGKHVGTAEAADIFNFKDVPRGEAERRCLACHQDGVAYAWMQGEHALNGVACVQCHKIHQERPAVPADRGLIEKPAPATSRSLQPPRPASLRKEETALCRECHPSVVSRMMLPSRHPVREGKMSCSSCHNVHGTEVAGLKSDERRNDLCLGCHASKQGPFVFDHQPVSEDCGSCHVPHGSVNNNLLKQNEPFLCLQCHESHFHIGRSGATVPVMLPSGGSQNPFGESGWRRAFGTKCTQCHVSIHGSDLPGQSVPGRGKSLIR